LQQLLATSLGLADPRPLVRAHLALTGDLLKVGGRIFPLSPESRIVALSLGKAAPAMAQAASSALGPALHQGLLIAPEVPPGLPARFHAIRGGHPLPDEGSLRGGEAAEELVRGLESQDLLLALVSGGGSACMEIPVPGIDLETLREVNRTLILSGAGIEEINLIRSALSCLKRGGLARRAVPAQTIGLVLSDVTGDRLELVASGPTVEASLLPAEVRQIARRHHLEGLLPASVFESLEAAPAFPAIRPEPYNLVIGSNAWLAGSVARATIGMGFEARVVATDITGEARAVGERIASTLRRMRSAPLPNPLALIYGGETTVQVRGAGHGGRNQELALSAAIHLEGVERTALMAFGTDGVDGNSDAAGAVVEEDTCQRASRLGWSPRDALEQNDSHGLFHRLGDCLHTGPTGTNLNDLIIALLFP
jgi:hydroxypyruvate reductase